MTAAVIFLIGFVPFPMNIDEVGVAEAEAHESVRPEWGGFVTDIVAKDHQFLKGPVRDADGKIIKPGDVILVAHDLELDKDIDSTSFRTSIIRTSCEPIARSIQIWPPSTSTSLTPSKTSSTP